MKEMAPNDELNTVLEDSRYTAATSSKSVIVDPHLSAHSLGCTQLNDNHFQTEPSDTSQRHYTEVRD